MGTSQSYTLSSETRLPFGEAVELTRTLLQEAGYGILCEIDVQAKLEEKLGIEREPYVILGACNPPLARQGLDAEPDLGALLPCNVVVYEREGRTHVSAVEPERMLSIVGNEALKPIAKQVRTDLSNVVEGLARS
ncbi:DUF302 domain-containing protein [Rubrobacter tropicus]|uniref:DUF302 domain-containing protein n=1 Tax=Rubrobacter tropicus TaxID=2653851 RepID=A0A6G8QD46_9ACTN|nr:DUF302 domain-containing protein [Rubrobacter tropicus]QIN84434.1 DUF302 domain-containing protein [Rubrobacter tropicus]